MVELLSFSLLFLLGLITIIADNSLVLKIFYVPALFFFMVIVRYSGFDEDILSYIIEMKYWSSEWYYLKEFIFWYFIRSLYYIFNSDIIVFLLMDMIWISLLLKTSFNLSNSTNINTRFGAGLIVILATSFPLFLGYQNIYRQLIATVLALFSYSLLHISYKRSILFFIISIFLHNITIILAPIFFIKKIMNFNIHARIFISLMIATLFIYFIVSTDSVINQKSAYSTNIDHTLTYFSMYMFLFVIYLVRFKFNFYVLVRKVPSLIIILILMMGLINLEFDMIAERIGMMFLVFLLFDLYKYSVSIHDYYYRISYRLCLLILFTTPVLISSSTLRFFGFV